MNFKMDEKFNKVEWVKTFLTKFSIFFTPNDSGELL